MTFYASSLTRALQRWQWRNEDDLWSQSVLQHLLEQIDSAAFLVSASTGRFRAFNGWATALTEWSRTELETLTLFALLQSGEALEYFATVAAGDTGRVFHNALLRTRSGRTVAVDLRLSAITTADELVVLGFATLAEERLAQERSATQLTRVLETIERLLAVSVAPTEEAVPRIVRLTQDMLQSDAVAFYRVTTETPAGLSLQQGVQLPASFPTTLRPEQAQPLLTPFIWWTTQRPGTYIAQMARAAGWQSLLAHPVGEGVALKGVLLVGYRPSGVTLEMAPALLAVIARQVNGLLGQIAREGNLTNAQQLAVRLSARLAAVTGQVAEGVLILNAEGAIDEINHAAAQLLGYRTEEVIGRRFSEITVMEEPLARVLAQALHGASVEALESKLHHRSGESFPVVARARPLREGGCVLTLRDISETRASQMWREHLDQLTYAGQATQSFAHEVRNPLNNIAMGVQFLASRLPSDDNLQEAFSKIQAECNRLSSLMKDMLAWAKPLDPKPEPTDLKEMLQRVLLRWNNKLERSNVKPSLEVAEACPRALVDPRLIEQVFVNLIENALQAMPAGGQLAIKMRLVNSASQGPLLEVRVSDTGRGMGDAEQRHAFDPYFTTRPDGTGLGLSICKRLVTVNRGAINVESFPGVGTIFILTLPAVK